MIFNRVVRTVRDAGGRVVLNIRADCRKVDLGLDSDLRQDFGVTYAGELENLRGLHRAASNINQIP